MDAPFHVFFAGRPSDPARPVVPVPLPEPDRDPAAEQFFDFLFRQAGLDSSCYRPRSLRRRLPACLRRLRVATPGQAQQLIAAAPERAAEALDTLLLGVTAFYRDAAVFAALREKVVPTLALRSGPPRIWSAACSNGHELYSFAILLAEAGWLEGADLLGTDFRAEAITEAGSGAFTAEEIADLPARMRAPYFSPSDGRWRASARLRGALRWQRADLLTEAACGPWDVILWRNMAIYLQPRAAEGIWTRLCAELRPGGFLVTGKAEYPAPNLPFVRVAPCIFQKEGAG